MILLLDGNSLTIRDVLRVAQEQLKVGLSSSARKRMKESRAWVDNAVRHHDAVYGVTTGFGAFQSVSIPQENLRKLQKNMILSHCAGVGEPFPEEVVRAMILLRANALAKGFSGIRVSTVERLLAMLNAGIHPIVPSQGSVGASGDLAPLSHVAAGLIGEGEAIYRGRTMSSRAALRKAGLSPVVLEAKEGIALNNGTQAMTAVGVLTLHGAEVLADMADIALSLTLEAIKGKSAPFHPFVHKLRPHAGQAKSASNIRLMIRGSQLVDVGDIDTMDILQDSYSVRCAPQVHGASRDAMTHVRKVLETEINSVTDNPLVSVRENCAFSAGNFHGQPVAIAMDFLALAVAELGNISERRTAKLMDKNHSAGLPAFLARNPGLDSGLMIAQYTAAALVSENKVLIHPASGDSIPTSANQEDHVSMGTISARHAARVVENVRHILAIELLCASRALEYREGRPGLGSKRAIDTIRRIAPLKDGDDELTSSIRLVAHAIEDEAIGLTQKGLRKK